MICREAGLSASVSDIQNLTDWPRRAILRRAHKLGLPTEAVSDRRRWTMAEFRFAIESVNHVSVKEIAEDLERSEKAVWDMLTHRGIPARFQDGYSVREISDEVAHPAAEHSGVGEIRRASQKEEWPDCGGLTSVLPCTTTPRA